MKRTLEVLGALISAIWRAVMTPSMTRVVVVGMAISIGLFLWTMYEYRELSVVPLGWLGGMGMATIFYSIDRYGFSKIDTVSALKQHLDLETSYGGWKYHVAYMAIYAFLIFSGYAVAFWVLGA